MPPWVIFVETMLIPIIDRFARGVYMGVVSGEWCRVNVVLCYWIFKFWGLINNHTIENQKKWINLPVDKSLIMIFNI